MCFLFVCFVFHMLLCSLSWKHYYAALATIFSLSHVQMFFSSSLFIYSYYVCSKTLSLLNWLYFACYNCYIDCVAENIKCFWLMFFHFFCVSYNKTEGCVCVCFFCQRKKRTLRNTYSCAKSLIYTDTLRALNWVAARIFATGAINAAIS